MKILVNTPVTSESDIIICCTSADIEINADLISTSGKIYILGKNVINNATLDAQIDNVVVVGLEKTINAETGKVFGENVNIGTGSIPSIFFEGVNISTNLFGTLTIEKD